MKKPINVAALTSELQDTAFFRKPQASPATPSAPTPDVQTPRRRDAQVPRHLGTQTPRRLDIQTPGHLDTQAPGLDAQFDLLEKADDRQTLRLTAGEFRHLGGIQARLSEELDVAKVEKNDIIRIALHRIFEEFEREGMASELVKRLKKKYR